MLPIADHQLVGAAKDSTVQSVTFYDGVVDPVAGQAGRFSVSAFMLEMDRNLLVAAEAVTLGPKSEVFRLRVFGEEDPFYDAMKGRMRPLEKCPEDLDLQRILLGNFQLGILQFRTRMTVELVQGREEEIDVLLDGGLVLLGTKGAVIVVELDVDIPLNLKITTSVKAMDNALEESCEIHLF